MDNIMAFLISSLHIIEAHSEDVVNGQALPLGYIVLGIIGIPVLILFIASFLIKPRSLKITGLFVSWVFLMFTAFIGAVFFLSFVFGFFY